MKSHIYAKAYLGVALSLTGCMGVYEGGFECPPGEGVGCKSISEVNEMANQCSLQYPVSSTQCSECKIPELRKHPHTIDKSEGFEGVNPSSNCISSLDIWYAPGAINSDHYSVSSIQKSPSQNLKPIKSEEKTNLPYKTHYPASSVQKDSLQNLSPLTVKTREFKGE